MNVLERFEAKYIPEPNSGCWLWLGSLDSAGYGWFGYSAGRMVRSHIAAYRFYVGAVPKGRELHHSCELKCCVNPEHLKPLTRLEHKRAHKLRYCRSGRHPLTDATQCAECKAEYAVLHGARNAANYRKRKGAAK